MKRLALLAALLACWAAPAFATGIAIITGTGTGGAQGTAGDAAVTTTVLTLTSSDVPAGSLVLALATSRTGTTTINSATDSASTPNSYSAGAAQTNNTVGARTFRSVTTVDLPAPCTMQGSMAVANTVIFSAFNTCISPVTFTSGQALTGLSVTAKTTFASNCAVTTGTLPVTCALTGDAGTPGSETMTISSTVTVTYSATAGDKGVIVAAFSNPAASPFDAASTTATGSSTGAISVGPTGTLACPVASNCEVVIGNLAFENAGAVTEDAAFTSLGTITGGAQSYMHAGYKIVSANTAITWAPSLGGTSAQWATQLQGFKAAGAAGGAHNLSLLGVGN